MFLFVLAPDTPHGLIVRSAALVDRGLVPQIAQQCHGIGKSWPL